MVKDTIKRTDLSKELFVSLFSSVNYESFPIELDLKQ
jgi:hypothetical protein